MIEATHEKVGFVWTLGYTIINDLGFANVLPVGLALYSRAAPRRLEGLVVGMYYLHLFIGNTFVGWLAGFLETLPGRDFWACMRPSSRRGTAAAGVPVLLRQAARTGRRDGGAGAARRRGDRALTAVRGRPSTA
jgi:POT family proton-dependent oligopeptide transporter